MGQHEPNGSLEGQPDSQQPLLSFLLSSGFSANSIAHIGHSPVTHVLLEFTNAQVGGAS